MIVIFGFVVFFVLVVCMQCSWFPVILEKIFGLSPEQKQGLELIKNALDNSNYRLETNIISYDEDTRVHLLKVFIDLPNVTVSIPSIAWDKTIMIVDNGVWLPCDFSSKTAVCYVYDFFSAVIYKQEKDRENYILNKGKELSKKALQ